MSENDTKIKSERKPFLNKRTKLIILISAIASVLIVALTVTLVMIFRNKEEPTAICSYYDLFDEDMPYGTVSYDPLYTSIPELEGYVIATYSENGNDVELLSEEFAVFVKLTDSGILSHKVLSMRSRQVVATFAAKNTTHDIRLVENTPAFFVKKTVIDPDIDAFLGLDNVISIDYSLYDAAGNCVVTSDNSKMPYELADLLIYDYAAYRCDTDGIITKEMDVPEYLMLDECFDWNDEYIYVKDSSNGYTVYDRNLNSVSYWCAPGYNMDGCDMFVMNSKNVLVQYKVILDEDATDFDYVINNDDYKNLKINLETFIVDVKTGEATELVDFAYVVAGLMSRESMVRGSADPNAKDYFKFENLITLVPIVETRLDDSAAAIDLVKMSDSGELGQSVKFVDFQKADIPSRISEELFTLGLLSGQTAIIKHNGEVCHKLDKYYRIVDQYIVGSQAIYSFNMEKVYDLRENKGSVISVINNTVYINVETSVGFDIIAFRGGETKTLYSFNAESPSGDVFSLMEEARCYMIYNSSSGEFTYYNSEDERIANSDEMLNLRHASESHSSYLMWTSSALELEYCIFTNIAEAAE